MDENAVGREVIDAAVKVHYKLGPGLLESAYETCIAHELRKRCFAVRRQVAMPIEYDGIVFDMGYRLDLLVEDKVVLELKAVEKVLPVHAAQLLSYLRLGSYRLGFLLNFNTVRMADGIKRIVNGLA